VAKRPHHKKAGNRNTRWELYNVQPSETIRPNTYRKEKLEMIRTCPNCKKKYMPILKVSENDNRPIQQIFPHAPRWQREQLISGICSDQCWKEYLQVTEDIE